MRQVFSDRGVLVSFGACLVVGTGLRRVADIDTRMRCVLGGLDPADLIDDRDEGDLAIAPVIDRDDAIDYSSYDGSRERKFDVAADEQGIRFYATKYWYVVSDEYRVPTTRDWERVMSRPIQDRDFVTLDEHNEWWDSMMAQSAGVETGFDEINDEGLLMDDLIDYSIDDVRFNGFPLSRGEADEIVDRAKFWPTPEFILAVQINEDFDVAEFRPDRCGCCGVAMYSGGSTCRGCTADFRGHVRFGRGRRPARKSERWSRDRKIKAVNRLAWIDEITHSARSDSFESEHPDERKFAREINFEYSKVERERVLGVNHDPDCPLCQLKIDHFDPKAGELYDRIKAGEMLSRDEILRMVVAA